jgi:hypothetical protein
MGLMGLGVGANAFGKNFRDTYLAIEENKRMKAQQKLQEQLLQMRLKEYETKQAREQGLMQAYEDAKTPGMDEEDAYGAIADNPNAWGAPNAQGVQDILPQGEGAVQGMMTPTLDQNKFLQSALQYADPSHLPQLITAMKKDTELQSPIGKMVNDKNRLLRAGYPEDHPIIQSLDKAISKGEEDKDRATSPLREFEMVTGTPESKRGTPEYNRAYIDYLHEKKGTGREDDKEIGKEIKTLSTQIESAKRQRNAEIANLNAKYQTAKLKLQNDIGDKEELAKQIGYLNQDYNDNLHGVYGRYDDDIASKQEELKELKGLKSGKGGGGKSGKTIVSTGTGAKSGRKIIKYSDGTTEYAD